MCKKCRMQTETASTYTWKKEAVFSIEASVTSYHSPRRHVPLRQRCCSALGEFDVTCRQCAGSLQYRRGREVAARSRRLDNSRRVAAVTDLSPSHFMN